MLISLSSIIFRLDVYKRQDSRARIAMVWVERKNGQNKCLEVFGVF
jgi:hypothetical protein